MTALTEDKLRETEPYEELLGTLLTYPDLFPDYRGRLGPELFAEYGWLYDTILKVHEEEGLTFKGIGARCSLDQIKILHELRNTCINPNRVSRLISESKRILLSRQMKRLTVRTIEELGEYEADPDQVLRTLQQEVMQLATSESDALQDSGKDVDEWAEHMLEIHEDPSKAFGLMTGIHDMDGITTGWHRKDFVVVGARTSMGKSAFMLENVLRLNKNGYKTAIFSLEMTKRQIYTRMMANLMQVPMEQLRTGRLPKNHYDTLLQRKEELKSIYVDDTRGVTPEYIGDAMRQLKRTRGLDFVVVDYLQDVKEKGETNDNQGSALARVCRKLRATAQECDCVVMGLSQVARVVEDRQDKRPGNADLSGSTGIETSADVIALLYRDEYYNPQTDKRDIMEVNFTKQRNGRLGKVELFYAKEHQRIVPLNRKY